MTSYDNIVGGENHWMVYLDGVPLMHYGDEYNILIASLDKASTARVAVV